MVVINPSDHDFVEVHEFVGKLDGLELYPVHFYQIMIHYFGNSFFLIRQDRRIAGLAWGITSQKNKDVFFLWQLGVLPEYRGRSFAKMLIDKVIDFAADHQCRKIHGTVEPSNIPSWRLLEKLGFKNISKGEVIEKEGKRAIADYYGSGTSQIFFEYTIPEALLYKKSHQLP